MHEDLRGGGRAVALHVRIQAWAHCVVFFPACADTLAALTHGSCQAGSGGDLGLRLFRCWDMTVEGSVIVGEQGHRVREAESRRREVVPACDRPPTHYVAPGLAPSAWRHPIHHTQRAALEGIGVKFLSPHRVLRIRRAEGGRKRGGGGGSDTGGVSGRRAARSLNDFATAKRFVGGRGLVAAGSFTTLALSLRSSATTEGAPPPPATITVTRNQGAGRVANKGEEDGRKGGPIGELGNPFSGESSAVTIDQVEEAVQEACGVMVRGGKVFSVEISA